MIWLKRLLPIIILAAGIGGYFLWDKWSTQRELREQDEIALVTARVWIATAKYRNEPEKYLHYRDSLLEAGGANRREVMDYLKREGDPPEELLPFARRVHDLVDSLYRIEDSILRDREQKARDSVPSQVDTLE